MHLIFLKNNKSFQCAEDETILEGARKAGIILEHSCLSGRCSSCKVKVDSGISVATTAELGLNNEEKEVGNILSCIRKPKSNMVIQAEDLSEYGMVLPKTIPAKINSIEKLTEDVIKVILRFPPTQSLNFIPGQYVNIIKGSIKRSYSIANAPNTSSNLEFFIKKYSGGLLSQYWFNEAKVNDLLRVEGPKGAFFVRKSTNCKNIILLATGTGIAPVKSILESMMDVPENFKDSSIFLFWGVRHFEDLFWNPLELGLKINYSPVLSRETNASTEFGYVQNVLLKKNLDLKESMVYDCGSNDMIQEAKNKLIENGLPDFNFYSDAFVTSN